MSQRLQRLQQQKDNFFIFKYTHRHEMSQTRAPAKLLYPLEIVCRYRDPQLQVGKNYLGLATSR